MTPLIDVMLVLLVIFIITAPLFTHAIRLDLPKVVVAIGAADAGHHHPFHRRCRQALLERPARDARRRCAPGSPTRASARAQPEIHLRASGATRYDVIAQVMGAAQQAGLDKIGFVTEPKGAKAQ